ncbi:MAG: GNAT family N-acetyltransferase [Ignavibacteriales bacterium]|nr:MAG: GNAT family N-acetyltransferase [Ignavibacteriales bacterium]
MSEITDVLCEAFYNYPVMKYVLGEKENYPERLNKLVTFFVSSRILRNEPLLGVYNSENKLVAAATVTLPGEISSPEELKKLRDKTWAEIGVEEKARYEMYGSIASGLLTKEAHHHLNMIGVRNAYRGKGLARQLINKVEELVSAHPTSAGLSLNTEVEANVNFYLHFGFELSGKAIVTEDIVTCGFFKARKQTTF